jgi:hemoglobin
MRDTPRRAPTGDLDAADEIAEMVRRFYADVTQDDLLGPMFNEVARVDWSEHLAKLTAFWCRALLGQPGYQGNPIHAHLLVHARREFAPAHFERWLTLFHETLELGWTGPNARRAGELADNVARVHGQHLLGHAVSLNSGAST